MTIPALQRLQAGFRRAGVEVVQTTIESLTLDGRDRSLDYKITPIHVPKGSWDARPIDEIAPRGDEIVIPKTSSSVFVSTNIDYVLRNLGVRQLVIGGLLTDQCVESAVRDACDLGYLVTLVTDATADPHARAARRLAQCDQGLLPPAHRRPGHRGAEPSLPAVSGQDLVACAECRRRDRCRAGSHR